MSRHRASCEGEEAAAVSDCGAAGGMRQHGHAARGALIVSPATGVRGLIGPLVLALTHELVVRPRSLPRTARAPVSRWFAVQLLWPVAAASISAWTHLVHGPAGKCELASAVHRVVLPLPHVLVVAGLVRAHAVPLHDAIGARGPLALCARCGELSGQLPRALERCGGGAGARAALTVHGHVREYELARPDLRLRLSGDLGGGCGGAERDDSGTTAAKTPGKVSMGVSGVRGGGSATAAGGEGEGEGGSRRRLGETGRWRCLSHVLPLRRPSRENH